VTTAPEGEVAVTVIFEEQVRTIGGGEVTFMLPLTVNLDVFHVIGEDSVGRLIELKEPE
jgi:hypothetical protein